MRRCPKNVTCWSNRQSGVCGRSQGGRVAGLRSRIVTLAWAVVAVGLAGVGLAAPASQAQEGVPGVPPAPSAPSLMPPPPAPGKLPPVPELVGPQCTAASAILVDAATGTVLWEKDARTRRPMASTTKIMTGTLMIESGRLDEMVKFSEHARMTPYANLNAKPGEQVRMRDLLYAVMLRSSNDSCVAVGEHLAGAAWKFSAQMTARARSLGAMDTNYVTTNGLYAAQHYTTAYDLALITRHGMQYPLFNEVVATKERWIERTMNPKDRLIRNHNKLLSRYDGADGVKTGYVRQSGKCLVASSTRLEGGRPWRLLAVVLNSSDTYGDTARMMDWGRKYFQPIFLARQNETMGHSIVRDGIADSVPVIAKTDLAVIVPRQSGKTLEREVRILNDVPAPIGEAQVMGRAIAMVDGQALGEVDLVADRSVGQVKAAALVPWTTGSMLLAALTLVPRYARTIAKGPLFRRRRVSPRGGEPDFEREGDG